MSRGHTHFHRLLVLWVRGRMSPSFRERALPHTSISINKGFAAKLHRDRLNEGPSVALAVGAFTGGGLQYWPGDDKKCGLERLRDQPSIVLDTRKSPCVFDGNCGHEVQPFLGERFSIVAFTVHGYRGADRATRRAIKEAGGEWPSHDALQRLREKLPRT